MKPQTQKLLSGGLNLLQAADAIAEGQAIACENWRVDQQGILRSRKGMTLVHDFGAVNVHTIINVQALASRRYYGEGANLHRGIAAPIATGFDGTQLGMVSFQSRVWCMNQAKQVKDDGVNCVPWTVLAPTAAPTPVYPPPVSAPGVTFAGASTGNLWGTFEYYATPVTAGGVEGLPSLAQATPDLAGDKATVSAPVFPAGTTHWNLYRHDRTTEIVGGSATTVAYKVNISTIIAYPAGTFVDNGTATGLTTAVYMGLNGDYNYYVTGVTAYGEETNPSPALFCPTVENGWVGITRPTFADAQVTGWNVYRSGGAFPLQPYRVNVTTILLATTTYYDCGAQQLTPNLFAAYVSGSDQSDVGIAEMGLQLATNHDAPPMAKGLSEPYFSKLLAFNSLAHPNRIWWTPTDEPWYFPGSASEQDGNWVDVGEQGEAILAIAVFPRWAAIIKENSLWRLVGDPDTIGADIERTNAEVGQIGGMAWSIAGSTVYGQAAEYLFSFNGDKAISISPALDPLFKGDAVLQAESMPSLAVDPTHRTGAVMAYRNGRLYFSYPEFGSAVNNRTLIFNSVTSTWQSDNRGFSALFYEGQGGSLLGAIAGKVFSIEDGTDDNGTPIVMTYQTRYEDQGAPENDKRYSDILIEHNTGGRNFQVWAYLENGTSTVNLGTINSVGRTQQTFTLGDLEKRNIAIRLVSSGTGGESQFFAIALHYIVLERNARTYDTEKVPLPKLSLLNALELDLEIISGAVTYTVYSGTSAMSVLQTGTYTGAAIETFQALLPDNSQAKWVRLTLDGDNYRCRGARLQFQPIGAELVPGPPQFVAMPVGTGAFLDPMTQSPRVSQGTLINSWTWDSGKVPLSKLSLLNGLEIGAEILAGNVNATFSYGTTDLATSLTYTLSDSGQVQVFVEAIPDATTARWVRLQLQGDNWRFHGARIQLQEIGVDQRIAAPQLQSLTGGQGGEGVFINSWTWDSGKLPLEKQSLLNGLELALDIISGPVTATLNYGISDLGTTQTYTLTDSGNVEAFVEAIPDNTQARWVQLLIAGDNWKFHGARLQFQQIGVEQRIAAPQIMSFTGGQGGEGFFINSWTWDSGKVALEKLSLLNGLELTLDIIGGSVAATLNYGITDLTAAQTYTLTDAGGVQAYVEAIPDATTARWVRLQLQGDNWRFHGARIQFQKIGVEQRTMEPEIASLPGGEGAAGVFLNSFTWDSGKIELDKISLLNALEVSVDILGGAVNYSLAYGLTDLNATITGSLAGTVGAFIEVLPDATLARWVRLIVQGDNYRWHGARLQLQPVGVDQRTGSPEIVSLSGGQGESGVFINSRTYDSGKVALDKVNVLQTLEVELDILGGAVAFTFEAGISDLPTVITGMYTGNVHTFTTALQEMEARWYRLILTGPNFRCHGARLSLHPIGVYLAGVGDMYRSGDMTLGSPRVKLLQQIRVDCRPDGTIPASFDTDAPGAMAQRLAFSLVASGYRGYQRFNLPRDTRGRVLRIEFTGAAVARIYAIQVRSKTLGEGEGTWQWLNVPVAETPTFSWQPISL